MVIRKEPQAPYEKPPSLRPAALQLLFPAHCKLPVLTPIGEVNGNRPSLIVELTSLLEAFDEEGEFLIAHLADRHLCLFEQEPVDNRQRGDRIGERQ